MAINLEAFELFSSEGVSGKGGTLETVSDVTKIGDPSEIDGNGVEADEESGEEKERYRHHRRQENSVLYVHCGTNDETDRLRDERYQETSAEEHAESRRFGRLTR